jgi:hypothetical protein
MAILHPPYPYHTVAQLYGLPHGILHVFKTLFFTKNEFQNPQILMDTLEIT